MNWKRFNHCFFLILIFFAIAFFSEDAGAQEEKPAGKNGVSGGAPIPPVMGTYYPSRYRIRGLIEFRYYDYKTKITKPGTTIDSDRKTFEQRYRLGLEGYIYHPRLAIFSTYVSLYNRSAKEKIGKDKYNEINYNFSLTLLPLRPVSLDLYGSHTTGTYTPISNPAYDTTSNNYGLRLFLRPRSLPTFTIRYDYWDYDSERYTGKITTSRYGLDIVGRLRSLRTSYSLSYELVDYSGPNRSYSYQYINAETRTAISKEDVLHFAFQYDSLELTKILKFAAELELSPVKRFRQSYSYLYILTDTGQAKTDYHNIRGSWGYRVSSSLDSRASAGYTISKRDGVSENLYDFNLGLNYGRPVKGFDLRSYYKLSYIQRGSNLGTFIDNELGLGISTRDLKFGKIYAEYDLTYDIQDEGNYIEHRLRAGIEGRGPGRGYWNLEGQVVDSTNDLGGQNILIVYGGGPVSASAAGVRKAQYYTLTARLGYPLSRRGLVTLEGDYTTGTLDSRGFNSYYYETRLNYRIFKNLSLLAWWRQEWDNIEGSAFTKKARDIEIQLNYRLRRVFATLEYRRWRVEEGPTSTDVQIIYMRLTRPI